MALVVVLTVVVLATILVSAFVSVAMLERSSSGHYAASLRAEEVARAGYTTVLADLRREISAGSTVVTNAGGAVLFNMPRTNWTMIPQTNIAIPNTPSLVRFSSTNVPTGFTNTAWFDTNALPPNRSSTVSTATKSRNNRKISATSWLAPRLIPTNSAAAVAALTNNPPSWIYLTRSGARALANTDAPSAASSSLSNTNYVIGRFAYAIYDTGGLLDANLAGAPSDTAIVPAAWAASKANQAFADLTQVGLTAAQTAALVQWRNAASAADTNSYTRYIRQTGPTNGFVTGVNGDRKFFSRSDFLRYADVNAWTPDAIASFTTFQRDPAAPGLFPTYDANTYKPALIPGGGAVSAIQASSAYRTIASTTPGATNPAVLQVRKADGTPEVSNRFNLDRLLWLTREGPIASLSTGNSLYTTALAALGGTPEAAAFLAQGTSANIQKYFGLCWDGSPASWNPGNPSPTTGEIGQMWIYCSPTGSLASRAGSIKTLAQAAAENREPDLFELVQAAILSGSLGQATGDPSVASIPNTNVVYGEWERRFAFVNGIAMGQNKSCNTRELRLDKNNKLFHAEPKYQVARIIANLVDQADADSYPTAIRLNEETVWGIEDLPLFNGVGMFAARPLPNDAFMPDPNQRYVHQWALFSLWNPHVAATSPGSAPDTFRIICRSGFTSPYFYSMKYYLADGVTQANNWLPTTTVSETFLPSPSWIQFLAADYGGFREPTMVTPKANTTISAATASGANRITVGRVDLMGLHTGRIEMPDHPDYVPLCAGVGLSISGNLTRTAENIVKNDSPDGRGLMWKNGNSMNLELQYRDPSGGWRTYDVIYGFIPDWTQVGFTNYLMPDDPNYGASLVNMKASIPGDTRNVAAVPVAMLATGDFKLLTPAHLRIDPRTSRLNMGATYSKYYEVSNRTQGWISGQLDRTLAPYRIDASPPSNSSSDTYSCFVASPIVGPAGASAFFTPNASGQMFGGMFANNYSEINSSSNYGDPDLVQRLGDAGSRANNHPGTVGNTAARPIILNRPFRNVGEIGVVFRDTPWRTLDLLSEKSADAGLLDIFCVGETPATPVAGRVNLNSAPRQVLMALISGSDRTPSSSSSPIAANSATNIVSDILGRRTTNGPIQALSQLPALFPQTNTVSADYPAPKLQREAAARALAGVGTTRTWNLLVDVVAQSGRLAPNASSLSGDFIVEGQKRVWFQVSVDRLTGEVVAIQSEPYEE